MWEKLASFKPDFRRNFEEHLRFVQWSSSTLHAGWSALLFIGSWCRACSPRGDSGDSLACACGKKKKKSPLGCPCMSCNPPLSLKSQHATGEMWVSAKPTLKARDDYMALKSNKRKGACWLSWERRVDESCFIIEAVEWAAPVTDPSIEHGPQCQPKAQCWDLAFNNLLHLCLILTIFSPQSGAAKQKEKYLPSVIFFFSSHQQK